MAFTGAAQVVVAHTFQLIDNSGVIVGQLGTGLGGSPALDLLHNDSLTTNSSIVWTQPNVFGAGFEELVIQGPEGVGQAGVPPAIILSRTTPQGDKLIQLQGANIVNIKTEDGTGNPSAEIDLVAGTGETAVFSDLDTKWSVSGASRGNGYGISLHEALLSGGNVAGTVAVTTLLTITLPSVPVAGISWVDISFSCDWVSQSAPPNSFVLQVYVDGGAGLPLAVVQNIPNGMALHSAGSRLLGFLATGVHTITLRQNTNAAASFAFYGSNQSMLHARLYR